MKIILAPDSFKHCMRSKDICRHLASGIREVLTDATIVELPLSDGGEGFVEAAAAAMPGGKPFTATVSDPLGRPVEATAWLADGGKTAILEVASACGIELISRKELNPMRTTTAGVGELITALLRNGVKKLIIGLGGSATVDGGMGMMQALGVRFFDRDNALLPSPATGESLLEVGSCDCSGLLPELHDTELIVASDVTNLLCGPQGAAPVFGPQKGATQHMVEALDEALMPYHAMLSRKFGKNQDEPGDGAAGGLGFALRMLGAQQHSGAELVLNLAKFDEKLSGADLVITGEGRSDAQTAHGKLPAIVAQHARRAGVRCVLASGALTPDADVLNASFDAVFSLTAAPESLEVCLKRTPDNLRRMGRNLAALLG